MIDKQQLLKNLEVIKGIQDRAQVHILIALKALAQFTTFELIRPYVTGATASPFNEALMGHKYLCGELHQCAPALLLADVPQLLAIADHIVKNSRMGGYYR